MSTTRLDSWQNTTAGFGTIRDKHTGLDFAARPRMSRYQLTRMYEQSWLVARIVDKIVDDAFRTGWKFANIDAEVDEADIRSKLDDLGAIDAIKRLLKWGRLYGAAVLLLPTLGTGSPAEPMRLGGIEAFFRPQVVTGDDAIPQSMDSAFGSPTYLQVLDYDIVGLMTSSVRVHHSRLVKHEPIDLPIEALLSSPNRWGPSILERTVEEIGRDGAAAGHAVAMMYVASILYLKLKGLRTRSLGKNGAAEVKQILANCRESLDSLGLLGLDAEDDIGALSLSTTGVHELLDRMLDRVAAAVEGMPREILLNESPTGLRGGELSGAQAIWNGTVGSYREGVVTPVLDRVLEVLFAWLGIPATSWTIEWEPLWEPDARESAEIGKMEAEADQIHAGIGALDSDEIRDHRHVQGLHGPVRVETDAAPAPLDLGAEEIEAYQAAQAPAQEAAPVAAEAMNGAQIESLKSIGLDVKAGLLTREQGLALISAGFPLVAAHVAEGIVGPAVVAPVGGPDAGPEGDVAPDDVTQAPIEPGDRIRVQEAAKLYGLPTAAITAAIRRGELRSVGLGAHKIVSKAELQRLASEGPPPPAEPGESEPEPVV